MQIRKAGKLDLDSIHQLDVELTKFHKRFDKDLYEISKRWWGIKRRSQLKALKDKNNIMLVAEENKKIIGYVWGYVEKLGRFKIAKVQEVVVTSKHTGKGIGTALLKQAIIFFKRKGCIIAETYVNVQNDAALKFYEKEGFKKGEYRLRLKIDKNRKFNPFF